VALKVTCVSDSLLCGLCAVGSALRALLCCRGWMGDGGRAMELTPVALCPESWEPRGRRKGTWWLRVIALWGCCSSACSVTVRLFTMWRLVLVCRAGRWWSCGRCSGCWAPCFGLPLGQDGGRI